MKLLKRTWADVSLDNLAHNYTVLRQQVPAACRFLGVVKADAYGHSCFKTGITRWISRTWNAARQTPGPS